MNLKSLAGLAAVLLLVWGAREFLGHRQAEVQAQALKQVAKANDIVVYTTDTCTYCAQARQWLTTHQVPWTDCNVDHDAHCRATYESKGSPGVPLLKVRDQWQLGFDPAWVIRVLEGSEGA